MRPPCDLSATGTDREGIGEARIGLGSGPHDAEAAAGIPPRRILTTLRSLTYPHLSTCSSPAYPQAMHKLLHRLLHILIHMRSTATLLEAYPRLSAG